MNPSFVVIFHRREDFAATTPKTDAAILELVANNPKITKEELSGRLNITKDGVKYHIKKLREAGMLRRVGPSKGGHWEITTMEEKKLLDGN